MTDEQEILGEPVEELKAEDFLDLEKVIFNVETRDGRQFSLILGRQEGSTLSLSTDHEGEYQEVTNDAGQTVRTIFYGDQAWEFIIVQKVI